MSGGMWWGRPFPRRQMTCRLSSVSWQGCCCLPCPMLQTRRGRSLQWGWITLPSATASTRAQSATWHLCAHTTELHPLMRSKCACFVHYQCYTAFDAARMCRCCATACVFQACILLFVSGCCQLMNACRNAFLTCCGHEHAPLTNNVIAQDFQAQRRKEGQAGQAA